MTVWFTSDLHLGHRMVARLRGFQDPAEHDDAVAENWAARIRKNDQVWVLGDLAVSSPAAALARIATLPGEKHLITGNHDECFPAHRDAYRRQGKYLEVFSSVQSVARRRVEGRSTMLSHFPYPNSPEADHTEILRYSQYRLPDEGDWLLHGHTHSRSRGQGREIHVGLDAWGLKPVSLDSVSALMVIREQELLF